MAMESPFLLFKVECPICKTINEFEIIRVGAYAEEGRDTDFCPVNIRWRFPRYQAYNPLVFFTATCGNCYYSREFTNTYKDWKNDVNFKTYRLKTVKGKHLDQLSTAGSVVKLMGEQLDVSRFPNESAILKLHLAIYDEHLADHYSRLDVGRFYLRIAWVFRDMERNDDPNRVLLAGLIHDFNDRCTRVKDNLREAAANGGNLESAINSHFNAEQLSPDYRSQILSFAERYQTAISALKQGIGSAEERLGDLKKLLDDYRMTLLGNDESKNERSFGRYESFRKFLHLLRGSWDGIVTDEREALEKAVFNYKEAFANGRDIAPGNQQIQASYLIAELSRRIGDYDEAKQYFTSTIKSGQEYIYQNRQDQSRIALARKILELAIEQGRANLAAARPA
jgi:uncharacterized protein (DUF2225 family)